jgi:crossover junction endodeoxyribonuclease RuvC
LLKIYDGIEAIVAEFQPDVLAVEEAFYAINVKVALRLGQVRGVVLLLGEKNGIEIFEYSPRLIKQTVVGYGNAEKHQVQEMVRLLLKMQNCSAASRCGRRTGNRHLSFSSCRRPK